jgi:hypothetical protein
MFQQVKIVSLAANLLCGDNDQRQNMIPEPQHITYPTILDFTAPKLDAYHPASVIAEKVNAMIVVGVFNSRMKDFYVMYVNLQPMHMNDETLKIAIESTFKRRQIPLPNDLPIALTDALVEDDFKETQWQAFFA